MKLTPIKTKAGPNEGDSCYRVRSDCGKYIYHFSIIDYLSTFGTVKRLEVLGKTWMHNIQTYELSAMAPNPYGDRFLKFLGSHIMMKQKIHEDEMQFMIGSADSPDPTSKRLGFGW